jgi:hypothetical protein
VVAAGVSRVVAALQMDQGAVDEREVRLVSGKANGGAQKTVHPRAGEELSDPLLLLGEDANREARRSHDRLLRRS